MQTFTKIGLAAVSLLIISTTIARTNTYALGAKKSGGDSSRIREVLLSQKLCMVKFAPAKGKALKGKKKVEFRAELRGVFMVAYSDKDTTFKITDWIRCPAVGCPAMKIYTYGTSEYNRLDTLIALSKKNTIAEQRQFAKAMADNKLNPLSLLRLDTLLKRAKNDILAQQNKLNKKAIQINLPKTVGAAPRK